MDALAVMKATRRGYEIFWQEDHAWFRKDDRIEGPFKNLDDASYAALSDADVQEIIELQRLAEEQKKEG